MNCIDCGRKITKRIKGVRICDRCSIGWHYLYGRRSWRKHIINPGKRIKKPTKEDRLRERFKEL